MLSIPKILLTWLPCVAGIGDEAPPKWGWLRIGDGLWHWLYPLVMTNIAIENGCL